MDELYKLVEAGKAKQKIDSDRGYAIANGINPQVIVDLKGGKSMPNAINMLKILSAAGMGVNEGISAIEKQKEAGFVDIGLLAGIGTATAGGMALLAVPYSPETLIFSGVAAGVSTALYIMRTTII